MEIYRLIITIGVLIIALIDLVLTYFYLKRYKEWQPNKPFKEMERNPLIVYILEDWSFLGKQGLLIGMIIVSIIFLTIDFIILFHTHFIFTLILYILLSYTIYNHHNNFKKIEELIIKYPKGYITKKKNGNI